MKNRESGTVGQIRAETDLTVDNRRWIFLCNRMILASRLKIQGTKSCRVVDIAEIQIYLQFYSFSPCVQYSAKRSAERSPEYCTQLCDIDFGESRIILIKIISMF